LLLAACACFSAIIIINPRPTSSPRDDARAAPQHGVPPLLLSAQEEFDGYIELLDATRESEEVEAEIVAFYSRGAA
jgi:hypothetical protein